VFVEETFVFAGNPAGLPSQLGELDYEAASGAAGGQATMGFYSLLGAVRLSDSEGHLTGFDLLT
jgi:hypothetical protein